MLARITGLILMAFAASAAAQIYRCEGTGTLEFSDRPCGAEARIHRHEGMLSIVVPADGLGELREQSRAFLEQRRQRLAERQRSTAGPRRYRPDIEDTAAPRLMLTPPWLFTPAQRAAPGRPPTELIERHNRFSALNGPFPGDRGAEQRRRILESELRREDRRQ